MMAQKSFATFIAIGRWLVRIAPKVGLGVLVLFVLLAIPWTYFNIKWGRELEAELAALKAQGMPLTMVEAAPKPVPDDQNAAVVYQEVFKVRFPPAKAPYYQKEMAGLSNAEQGAFADYLKEPNAELEKQVRQLLARPEVQHALEIFRRGSQRQHSVFRVRWEVGPFALFLHMARFRGATRIIAAYALILAKDGHLEQALDWCQVALLMSEHAASEPTVIAQLVSYAMQNITFGAVKQIVSAAEVSPETADRFQRHLRETDLYQTFTAAMIGERAMGRYIFDELNKGPYEFCRSIGFPFSRFTVSRRLYFSWLARPVRKLNQLAYLRHMDKQIKLAVLPYHEFQAEHEAQEVALQELPLYWDPFDPLNEGLFPEFTRATQKRDQGVANIGLCRVVLALKAYKYERGAYPDTLEQLQQTLDWQLPEDPFSGEDFIYRRQGDGFLVYSIGRDLEDDGGLPERDEQGKWRDDADIVWECVR